MKRVFPLFCLILLAAFSGLAAQSVDVETLHARLSHEDNVAELRKRESSLVHVASTSPDAQLERGLVLTRLYELTNDEKVARQARSAIDGFMKASPKDARGYYGLGLYLKKSPEVHVPSPGGVANRIVLFQSVAEAVGADAKSKAARAFRRALELDPALAGAAVQLADLAIEKHDRDLLRASRDALQRLIELGNPSGDVALALSRTQSALGDVDAAAEAADRAVSSGTADPAQASLARATALLRNEKSVEEGGQLWLAGAEKLTDPGAEAYFHDVAPLISASEKERWDHMSIDQKKEWLLGFWELRAAEAGVTTAERIAEHYRRVATATDKYRRVGKRGAAPTGALVANLYVPDDLPYDERGLIFVRHGKPLEVVRTSSPDLRPNESWVYRVPSGKFQLYNFVVLRDGPDYRLVDDVFQAMDPSTQGVPFDALQDMLKALGSYDARYYKLATRLAQVRHQAWMAGAMEALGSAAGTEVNSANANAGMSDIGVQRSMIAEDNRVAARNALRTDSDQPRFESDLPFYYDIMSFSGRDGATETTAAVAIPGRSLQPRQVGADYVYNVQLSFILLDTLRHRITRSDTTLLTRSKHVLGEAEYLRLNPTVSLPASNTLIHRVLVRDGFQPGRGQLYGGPAKVPDYTGRKLMISDIVLAEPESGSWKRGDARLGLVPPRQFVKGAPLRLFYELYNLPNNTNYTTEITIAPAGGTTGFTKLKGLLGGSGGKMSFSFQGSARAAANGIVQESRKITTQIKPGKYVVRVEVTNSLTKEKTVGETQFVVLNDKGNK